MRKDMINGIKRRGLAWLCLCTLAIGSLSATSIIANAEESSTEATQTPGTQDSTTGQSDNTKPEETSTTTEEETPPEEATTEFDFEEYSKYDDLEEAEDSDLTLLHARTVLDGPRWIQGFAKDSKYYYFAQMTSHVNGDVRITRVKYSGNGSYKKDHMDLKGFGHGTNIDVTEYKGKTYIWIGCKENQKTKRTEAISCIQYKKNKVYKKKGGNTFTIRKKGSLKKATNVFPAVSQDGKYLVVRYTENKKQYFQKYKIYNGNKIKTGKILANLTISATKADFQGFDVYKDYIYTIEGSPSSRFLEMFYPTVKHYPTVITRINMKTKGKVKYPIRGAAQISYREPEGIKIYKDKKKEIGFVTGLLEEQTFNLYRWKK